MCRAQVMWALDTRPGRAMFFSGGGGGGGSSSAGEGGVTPLLFAGPESDLASARRVAQWFRHLSICDLYNFMPAVPLLSATMGHHIADVEVVRAVIGTFRALSSRPRQRTPLLTVVPQLLAALERHAADVDVARHGLGCFWNLGVGGSVLLVLQSAVPTAPKGAPGVSSDAAAAAARAPLMVVMPLLLSVMGLHPASDEVVHSGAGCLRALACIAAARVPLMAAVPHVCATLGRHAATPRVVTQCVSFFWNLCLHDGNKAPLLGVLPTLSTALHHLSADLDVVRSCAGLLWNLAAHGTGDGALRDALLQLHTAMERHAWLGADMVPPVLEVLARCHDDVEVARGASLCCLHLLRHPGNHSALAAAVPALHAALLRHPDDAGLVLYTKQFLRGYQDAPGGSA
jgi:hypothetical protein